MRPRTLLALLCLVAQAACRPAVVTTRTEAPALELVSVSRTSLDPGTDARIVWTTTQPGNYLMTRATATAGQTILLGRGEAASGKVNETVLTDAALAFGDNTLQLVVIGSGGAGRLSLVLHRIAPEPPCDPSTDPTACGCDLDGDGDLAKTCAGGVDCDDDPQGCGAACATGNLAPDGCDGLDQDCDGTTDEDDPLCDRRAVLGPIGVTRVTSHGFIVTIDIGNDSNADAQLTLSACNRTDAPGCDPASGMTVGMKRAGTRAFVAIDDFEPPDDPGDLLALQVSAVDPDGSVDPREAVARLDGARHLFRSVGAASAAIASGAAGRTMTLSGRLARFSEPLPDNVGVGDAIQYDSDSDGVVDSIAFVHARHGADELSLRTASGLTPTSSASATAAFSVWRAYTRLAYGISATENDQLAASLRNFDGWGASFDLVAQGVVVHFAGYDDGLDSANADFPNTWTTSETRFVHVYTPTHPGEVGVSQRHDGSFARGYRRSARLWSGLSHLRLEGLAIQVPGDRGFFAKDASGATSTVDIAECFVRVTGSPATAAVDFYNNAGTATVRIWNTMAIVDQGGDGFLMNDDNATNYLYNCTAVTRGGGGSDEAIACSESGDNKRCYIRNSLAFASPGTAIRANSNVVQYSAFNDASNQFVADASNRANQTFTFRSADDFRLSDQDTAARGFGANLSRDTQLSFSTDLEGEPRPAFPAAWDIGADQTNPH